MDEPYFSLAVLGDLTLDTPDLTKTVRSSILKLTLKKRCHAKLAIYCADFGAVSKIASDLAHEQGWQASMSPPRVDWPRTLAIARACCSAVCLCDGVLFFVGRGLPGELGGAIRLARVLRVPHRVVRVG